MERLESVERNFKSILLNAKHPENSIKIDKIVNNIFTIDIDTKELTINIIDKIISVANKYEAMVTYEMQDFKLRFVFHFNRPHKFNIIQQMERSN